MKPNTKFHFDRILAKFVLAIDIPFLVIAYPHIMLKRIVVSLARDAMRRDFLRRGMCGGCSKYMTKKCKRHVKNPYSVLNRGCIVSD